MINNQIVIPSIAAGGSGGDTHPVQGSGLFDGSSGYLSRTPTSVGSNTTWTFEILFKRVKFTNNFHMFGWGADTNNRGFITFRTGGGFEDILEVGQITAGGVPWTLETKQVFRDPSAYMQIIVAVDTTQAIETNRAKIYINGAQVQVADLLLVPGYPSLNLDTHMNDTVIHRIGSRPNELLDEIPDYVARVALIDGSALEPTDFGEFTEDGFWRINDISGLSFGDSDTLLGGGITGSRTDNSIIAGAGAVHTFSNQAIGTASSDRVVIVTFGSLKDIAGTTSVTGVTIGGIAATAAGGIVSADGNFSCFCYYATVPTGTTANIVITHSLAQNSVGIGVYTTTNVDEVHDVITATNVNTDALSFSPDVPAGGFVVGYVFDSASSTFEWTELTEDFDEVVAVSRRHSGASKNYPTDASPTITVDPTGSDTTVGIVVAFSPTSSSLIFGSNHNGFLIEGGINMAAGNDTSGSANNFTPNPAGTITATADSPTNDADNGYGNYATFNPLYPSNDAASTIFSEGNRRVVNSSSITDNIGLTIAVPTSDPDKIYYCEFRLDALGEDANFAGVARPNWPYWTNSEFQLGDDVGAPGGAFSVAARTRDEGAGVSIELKFDRGNIEGDTFMITTPVIGDAIAVAIRGNKVWMGLADESASNTKWFATDGTERITDEPFLNTNEAYVFENTEYLLAGVSIRNSGGDDMTVHAEEAAWVGTAPQGAVPIATQSLPEPAAPNYEDEYFITERTFVNTVDDNTSGNSANNDEWDFIGNNGFGTSRTASTSDGGYIQIAGNNIPGSNGHFAGKNYGVISDTATVDLTMWYTGDLPISGAQMRIGIETVNYEHLINYGNDGLIIDGTTILLTGGSNYILPAMFKNALKIELLVDSETLVSTARLSVGGVVIGTGGDKNPEDPDDPVRFFPATGVGTRSGSAGDIIFGIQVGGDNPIASHRLYDVAITGMGMNVELPKSVDDGAMVRIKRTDDVGDWFVFDTLRGNNKFSLWNTTGVEDTTWTDQNLTGTTLTLPSALTSGNYLIEVFYVGEYFQINGFVGSHPAVQTLSYETDLDSAPGFMVFFNRDGSTQERTMAYHISTGNASRLDISDNVAAAPNAGAFGSFTPTTMEFKVGNEQNTNQNGANIISYHWANAGPYAFGSYVGNGELDGPVININGSPNSWFTKRIDSSDSWQLVAVPIPDNDFNPVTQRLQLEQAALISTNSNMTWDRLSNGWKVRGNDSGFNDYIITDTTYIYGAFGIEPIKYGRAK